MRIKNTQTGEIKEIDPSQASTYGISTNTTAQPATQSGGLTLEKLNQIEAILPSKFPNMSAQEKQAISQIIMQKKAELISSSGINPQDIPTDPLQRKVFEQQIQGGNYKPKISADEEKKQRAKTDAERVIAQLEDAYFGGNSGKGLAFGKLGGARKNIEAMLNVGEKIPPELEDLNTYKALRESVRPTFARAAGDVGNFSLPEQKAAVKNIPTEFQTKGEAEKYFASVRQKFGIPERGHKPQKTITQPSSRFKIETIE